MINKESGSYNLCGLQGDRALYLLVIYSSKSEDSVYLPSRQHMKCFVKSQYRVNEAFGSCVKHQIRPKIASAVS